MDFIINVTDVEDAITLKNGQFLTAVFTHAAEVVSAGGKILVQREYDNAKPDLLAVFSNQQDINNWRVKIDEILLRLSQ